MTKLGIVVPTNKPHDFKKRFLPTVEHLYPIRDQYPDHEFLINFQSPWSYDDAFFCVRALRNHGFRVKWQHRIAYQKPISIVRIRNDTYNLAADKDMYLMLEDDHRFSAGTPKYPRSSGVRYCDMIRYMEVFPMCGGVMARGALGGHTIRYKIRPVWNYWFSVSCGLLFRPVRRTNTLFLPKMYEVPGGAEESAAAMYRMANGLFMAVMMNTPTAVLTTRLGDQHPPDDMHNVDLIRNNIQRIIQEEYEDDSWNCTRPDGVVPKRMPDKIWKLYKVHGGEPYVFSRNMTANPDWVIDYE